MILNDLHIIEFCEQQNMIEPFNPMLVNPASYDLTLWGELIEITPGGIMDASNSGNASHRYTSERKIKLSYGQTYLLQPGVFILASSIETVRIPPTLAAEVKLKSTTARKGIGHVYSGWIDPGFEGQITFELFSHVPVLLEPGKPIAQIIFNEMIQVPMNAYQGRYQHQVGPTPARTFEDQYPIWDNYTKLMELSPALKQHFNEMMNIIPPDVDQIWSDAQGNIHVKSPDGQEHMLPMKAILDNYNSGIHPAQTVNDFVKAITEAPRKAVTVTLEEAEVILQELVDAIKEDFGPGTINFDIMSPNVNTGPIDAPNRQIWSNPDGSTFTLDKDNWSQRPRPRIDRDWGEENDL